MKIPLILVVLFIGVGALSAEDQARAKTTAGVEPLENPVWAGENNAGDTSWAGEYLLKYHLGGMKMNLNPKMRFTCDDYGCLGLMDQNHGSLTWSNGILHLTFDLKNDGPWYAGKNNEFIPVPWGERHYLIPSDEIVQFCNRVNQGRDQVLFFLREGDEKKPANGLPKIPEAFKPYLLKKPVEARIVSVGTFTNGLTRADWKFKEIPITINAGKSQGLLPSMELWATGEHFFGRLEIQVVSDNESVCIVDGVEEEIPQLKVVSVSSLAPWNKLKKESAK